MPNYRYLPVAYHGRSSSIVPSGAAVFRPAGQVRANVDKPPEFVPTRELDYELEVGFFVGQGNVRGVPLSIEDAEDRIFGFCLVNDWSARDIQRWEYQPLGPFLGKSFATTISPWVVTLEALAPFRAPAFVRPADDPQPLPHLTSRQQMAHGGIDLELEVRISTAAMRAGGTGPVLLSRSNFQSMYWTAAQMLTHHASNGCNLVAGDLLASGTVSGPSKESRGCLLELAWRGEQPVLLPGGESRTFLQDGDEIVFRGMCHREGFVPIGFGECRGQIAAVPGS
jgi:fumarylacetoacetase